MTKPIIFISHSSKDQLFLEELKKQLLRICNNEIEVFLSCDGQSIPFGHNWVHVLEKSLESTQLMFVILSPSSINSHWVYFESGYAYAKGVNVVPIALGGVDLGNLVPPITLLQGFNLLSHESLNNMIVEINKAYGKEYVEEFRKQDFDLLIEALEYSDDWALTNVINSIKPLFLELDEFKDKRSGKYYKKSAYMKERLVNICKKYSNNAPFVDSNVAYINGIEVRFINQDNKCHIKIHPMILRENLDFLYRLITRAYNGEPTHHTIRICFEEDTIVIADDLMISALIQETEIRHTEIVGNYLYEDIFFWVENKFLYVDFPITRLRSKDFAVFLKLLFELKIISGEKSSNQQIKISY